MRCSCAPTSAASRLSARTWTTSIVRGLYEHFVDCQGRQPDLDEFRDYVDRITSSIEWLDLHNLFSAA